MPSNVDEFTWVSDHRLDVPDPDGAMTDRARMALVNHMSAAIDRPGRRLPWLIAATAVAAGAAGAAGAVVLAVGVGAGSAPHRSGSASPVASLGQQPVRPSFVLLQVAGRAAQTPALPGNATLVKRSTDVPAMTGYDLYQDNGDYYYGQTLAALRSAASDPSPSDKQAAPNGQVVAAAAASADLTPTQAADKLLAADPHATPPKPGQVDTTQGKPFTWTQAAIDRDLDGIEWLSISEALEGGAGKPQVRAGALRAAAAMPDTTVISTTDNGQPVVEVTWDNGPYVESLTVDSQTGVLLLAHTAGSRTGVTSTTTYNVSRVTAPSLTAAH